MSDSENSERTLRNPVQERSLMRMARVLETAERMLEEVGPEKASIPALAEATGIPRAAIYPFFPDKFALFSRLALIHMDQLTKALIRAAEKPSQHWRDWVDTAIRATARYYNAHPAASVLLLRGSFFEADRAAHETKNAAIGELFRSRAASMAALTRLPLNPDAATIAVEIAFACMKHGYMKQGRISSAICREASRAVIAYLAAWDDNS